MKMNTRPRSRGKGSFHMAALALLIPLTVMIAGGAFVSAEEWSTHVKEGGDSHRQVGTDRSHEYASILADRARAGDFKLVFSGRAAPIHVDDQDHPVARIAAEDLADDIEKVTGRKPRLLSDIDDAGNSAVIVGTLGKSRALDRMVKSGRLDLSPIEGQWESFVIAVVDRPLPALDKALVIAGSDRRGTAFGVYELSRQIGVSPWCFWADAMPDRREDLIIRSGARRFGPPSVKYRGIFINDEDFGLKPWAAETFDPELGDIGPKIYEKVFELLLRLKANHLWPAMHKCTHAFNFYPENKVLADRYAIVMGSAHCEQMLRNNVDEWKRDGKGRWWYQFNRRNILAYWEQRVRENGQYENVYTLGMRALHDSPIHAVGGMKTRIRLLERIIADQRGLLAKWVNPDVTVVPQVFCPYNEVLHYLEEGLEVPSDVTLMWVDDNHGYIRLLSSPGQRERPGGSGVYYHVSYWGPPHDYLWLCSTPPALIREEMYKAYANGADRVWILNVGDIKPAEIDIEFFLQMAWDVGRYGSDAQDKFLTGFFAREFGNEYAAPMAGIMNQYYLLNNRRKPEHMGFNMLGERFVPVRDPRFSLFNYGDEAQRRIDAYVDVEKNASRIHQALPPHKRDAFYHFVLYSLRCSRYMNEKVLYAYKSRVYAGQGRAEARLFADMAGQAFQDIGRETAYYNNELAGGKWRGMVNDHPKDLAVFAMPKTGKAGTSGPPALGVSLEGSPRPLANRGELPRFSRFTRRSYFIDLFNKGRDELEWSADSEPWVMLSSRGGNLVFSQRIWVEVDFDRAPKGRSVSSTITVSGLKKSFEIMVTADNPEGIGLEPGTFVQDNGVIAINAENFASKSPGKSGADWTEVSGLGRTGEAMAVLPPDAPPGAEAPMMEYPLYVSEPGDARLVVDALPTYPVYSGRRAVVGVSIDDNAPTVVEFDRGGIELLGFQWSEAMLSSVMHGTVPMSITEGPHVLRVWGIDSSVVVDRVVIDFGGMKDSYLGPPETAVR